MKTSEISGPALDWVVAKCEGYPTKTMPDYGGALWQCGPGHWQPLCKYSTDWAQGGPIIEREGINLELHTDTGKWAAWTPAPEVYVLEGYATGSGSTPLIAAMKAFVASKLGDEVEVPDELS